MPQPESRRPRAVVVLLLLASVTIITLDSGHGTSSSPVDPLRAAVGDVLGPVEHSASQATRPLTAIPDHFRSVSALQAQNAALRRANARLQSRLRATSANVNRAGELQTIGAFADQRGYSVVPAQVIAMGPAQSFSRTVTIDAGTDQGVRPDMTVINANGLVGRVLASSATASTVLLIIDRDSTVGGRLGTSMELGFLNGTGDLGDGGGLTLSLVEHTIAPRVGDTVLSWGSSGDAPYLPGIPIGRVVSVHSTPAELTETAVVSPYVDFGSLDVVGVVTAHGGATGTGVGVTGTTAGGTVSSGGRR
jgi:rod shape-determining protein MreC